MTPTRLGAAAILIALFAGATAPADPVFGHWLTESGEAIVEIRPCDEGVCGEMAWLSEPRTEAGRPKLDRRNPDPELRDRPICGLVFMRGFERQKPGVWRDGRLYSPRHGETFGATLRVRGEEDGKLVVRGHVGIELLGRSQTWERVPTDRGGCPADVTQG